MGDIFLDDFDFPDIINQYERREMKQVHEFNLMLVGLTAVGKSTLVKSLFKGMIRPEEPSGTPKLNEYEELLEENGVKLRLRCIETSNYDQLNSDHYVKYINTQMENYFIAQCRHSLWNISDSRIHACLYLIQPYGKMKLRKDDIDCMKALHERVNLIPIIAKADTLNSEDLQKFKENIVTDLELNHIKYFKFSFDEKEDEERSRVVKTKWVRFPFAVVAADSADEKGRWIRSTIGGKIDISDETKCDFDALKKLMIRHCMFNLIVSTHVKHYAKFMREILDDAKLRQHGALHRMGLEPHEIKLIEWVVNPKTKANDYSLGLRQKAEKLQELQELRIRLQALQVQRRLEAK